MHLRVMEAPSSSLLLFTFQSLSATTGISRCPTGSTASRVSSRVTTPRRAGFVLLREGNLCCENLVLHSDHRPANIHRGRASVGHPGLSRATHGHAELLKQVSGQRGEGRTRVYYNLEILELLALLVPDADGHCQFSHFVPPVAGAGDAEFLSHVPPFAAVIVSSLASVINVADYLACIKLATSASAFPLPCWKCFLAWLPKVQHVDGQRKGPR